MLVLSIPSNDGTKKFVVQILERWGLQKFGESVHVLNRRARYCVGEMIPSMHCQRSPDVYFPEYAVLQPVQAVSRRFQNVQIRY